MKKFLITKNIGKVILILCTLMFIALNENNCYAIRADEYGNPESDSSSTSSDTTASSIISSGSDFINKGKENQVIDQQDILDSLIPIANIIVYIATGVFLVVGAILGLKYMLAESMQDRANIKKSLIWFVVAMFIVYGGVGIYNIVVSILNGLF